MDHELNQVGFLPVYKSLKVIRLLLKSVNFIQTISSQIY